MVTIGDKAPEFTLMNQEDQEVSLSDFAGQWLVLYFYPKDDTPGCTKEACDFSHALDDFMDMDANVIGISTDSTGSHRKFISKHDITITLLSDPNKVIHKAYGTWGLKKNFGKDYEGTIRTTFIISPEGEITAEWRNVRVRTKRKGVEVTHAEIVQEKLTELQS